MAYKGFPSALQLLLAGVLLVLAPHGLAEASGQGDSPTASKPVILNARIGEHPDWARFVMESSDPVSVRIFTLTNPNRVVIDMPEVLWRVGSPDRPSGHGIIKSYRYGMFRQGDSRFVIELNRPASVGKPLLLRPQGGYGYRTVLDFHPESPREFVRTAGWPVTAPSHEREIAAANDRPTGRKAAAQVQDRHVIVLDAGHGGIDSGTRGVDGDMEKNIALDECLRLGRLLERRGYLVRFTRTSDLYVPLHDRAAAAVADRADLFISLHADSNPDLRVSGASVYTLSEASSDGEAAALAQKENHSDSAAGVNLSSQSAPVASILIDLAQRDTLNRSARFAQSLISSLGRTTDLLPRTPHRSAGFVVLKTPGVAAVLIELGYLSNPGDCSRLATALWRGQIASAIAEAVDQQFRPAAPDLERVQAAN